MKTADQSIFDEMFKRSMTLGFKTYDYKPFNEIGYPFVEFESTDTDFNPNKTSLKGSVYLKISVWGLQKKRKEVSEMVNELFNQALKLKQSDGYYWALNPKRSQTRIIDDTSTNTPLKRGIIELHFNLR